LDRVEQHRAAVDQHDIAEVKVAMDATDEPTPSALDEKRPDVFIGTATRACELVDLIRRKHVGRLPEGRDVFIDVVGNSLDPWPRRDRWRARVRRCHGAPYGVCKGGVDPSLPGKMIEGLRLVEAAHFDCPFDRRAAAADRELPISLACDRHNAAVDL